MDGPFYGHYSTFPQALQSISNGPMNKLVMVAGMELMYEISNMNFYSSRLTQLWPPLNAATASSTDQQSHRYGTISWGDQSDTGRLIIQDYYFCYGRSSILSFWNKHLTLNMDLPSLHAMFLPKLSPMVLQNAFFTIMLFHTAVLLIERAM